MGGEENFINLAENQYQKFKYVLSRFAFLRKTNQMHKAGKGKGKGKAVRYWPEVAQRVPGC
jgi:hypothetical protein